MTMPTRLHLVQASLVAKRPPVLLRAAPNVPVVLARMVLLPVLWVAAVAYGISLFCLNAVAADPPDEDV